jgi:hypothetical protein
MKTLKFAGYVLLYVVVIFLIVGTIKNYVCLPFIK